MGLGMFLFTNKLSTMLNHLFHRTILQELAILVAVHAVIFVLTSVGIRSEDIIRERHSAALAKFLFHSIIVLYVSMLQKYCILRSWPNIWDKLHGFVTDGKYYRNLPLRILLRKHFTAGL